MWLLHFLDLIIKLPLIERTYQEVQRKTISRPRNNFYTYKLLKSLVINIVSILKIGLINYKEPPLPLGLLAKRGTATHGFVN